MTTPTIEQIDEAIEYEETVCELYGFDKTTLFALRFLRLALQEHSKEMRQAVVDAWREAGFPVTLDDAGRIAYNEVIKQLLKKAGE